MTAPVGPLDGAARVRPDGWLTDPLTTNPEHAAAQARVIVRRHHAASPGPVRCLVARYRTAVFSLGDPPARILKRHGDEAAFQGEALAYQLLHGEGVLPELFSVHDASRTLVAEYLPEAADISRPRAFEALVASVAAVHTAPSRWHPDITAATAPWRIGAMTAPAWVNAPDQWMRLTQLVASAHGDGHVPLGHLDLKADHARYRGGNLILTDVETLRPDLTGIPDLVTLACLANEHRILAAYRVRHLYRHHVNQLGAHWSDPGLKQALVAFAQATGLRSLHGAEA
ncbi:hypothetical protein [Streptomyces mobaraensis]|uniref:Phosphotransferase n=1 Tax=Streptomyces mobaraensis TaxID=35621 RepID=A0A5N5VYF4_STRMB|nr:hypothetical protein [Streptomyces mobaraensis]KAB7832515.1 hypothetical protein FRZ00_34790 [Streptomyces mobaraensis]